MEKIILEFLNVYFWVFSILFPIYSLYQYTDDFALNKKNAIKYGNYNVSLLNSILAYSLYILSIIMT